MPAHETVMMLCAEKRSAIGATRNRPTVIISQYTEVAVAATPAPYPTVSRCVGSQPPTPASTPTCRTYRATNTASTDPRLRPRTRAPPDSGRPDSPTPDGCG